ncbi:PhaM family polyhydroxyalkanoate granule multifunctional regulatory protein [Massilia sp. H6]|uniref:PhaM family polyhydroxyalkanoate granule multifunctional regulatory protein n=1 Tax=Massilia sp. H6 TaxID=2970464 RepID=UPI002167E974|nr:PhaM family polyhydroxyalkanoate granule multifunctional regulatory protein [Massilia sp. H6]UVW29216.1 hypothetical protein NRS07_03455 [Massilia sp. H6]
MLKPPMPNPAGMTDTLEFVKNLWGSMNIPGIAMPGTGTSLSTEDLDKKIADLKAVESWLNLNIGMLRGTIQALEVQRGTLATLKAMSDSMTQAMGRSGDQAAMTAPFAQFFAQAAQPAPSSPPASASAAAAAADSAQADQANPAGYPADSANVMPAAVAWWNLLQDQFRQAVTSATPMPGTHAAADDGGASSAPEPGSAGDAPEHGPSSGADPAGSERSSGKTGRHPRGKVDKA